MATAKYSGEEIEVEYSCRLEKADYGVRGSTIWYEDIEIDTLTILGVTVDPATLPKELVDSILELADYLEFEQ